MQGVLSIVLPMISASYRNNRRESRSIILLFPKIQRPYSPYQVFAPSLYPTAGFGTAALRLFAGFATLRGNGEEALCSRSEGMSPADGEGPRGRFDAENY